MKIIQTAPTAEGSPETFTGKAWVDRIADGDESWPVRVSAIHFTPGTRTAWHSHAIGQILYVTEGRGRVQSRGGEIVEIVTGDVVHTPADEWHWHGAAPDRFMTHLSVVEFPKGSEIPEPIWGAPVEDFEYLGEES